MDHRCVEDFLLGYGNCYQAPNQQGPRAKLRGTSRYSEIPVTNPAVSDAHSAQFVKVSAPREMHAPAPTLRAERSMVRSRDCTLC